jgi:hypothetical protein
MVTVIRGQTASETFGSEKLLSGGRSPGGEKLLSGGRLPGGEKLPSSAMPPGGEKLLSGGKLSGRLRGLGAFDGYDGKPSGGRDEGRKGA